MADAGTDAGVDAGVPGPNEQQARGEQLFLANCNVCHPGGEAGIGLNLITSTTTAEQIRVQVRNGRGLMPPFPVTVISDQQLEDIIAYVFWLRETAGGN